MIKIVRTFPQELWDCFTLLLTALLSTILATVSKAQVAWSIVPV